MKEGEGGIFFGGAVVVPTLGPVGMGAGLYFDLHGNVYPQSVFGTPGFSFSAGYTNNLSENLTGLSAYAGTKGIGGSLNFSSYSVGVSTPGAGVTDGIGKLYLPDFFSGMGHSIDVLNWALNNPDNPTSEYLINGIPPIGPFPEGEQQANLAANSVIPGGETTQTNISGSSFVGNNFSSTTVQLGSFVPSAANGYGQSFLVGPDQFVGASANSSSMGSIGASSFPLSLDAFGTGQQSASQASSANTSFQFGGAGMSTAIGASSNFNGQALNPLAFNFSSFDASSFIAQGTSISQAQVNALLDLPLRFSSTWS